MFISPQKFLSLALCAAALATPTFLRAGILEDRAIEDAINNSYVIRQVLTDRSMLQCYVRNGAVELRGQAVDEQERALVGYLIEAIPNVSSLRNQLFVDSDTRRNTDRWRAQRARVSLLTQAGFDTAHTKVVNDNGTWEITGTVADADERSRAETAVRRFNSENPVRVNLKIAGAAPIAVSTAPRAMDEPSMLALLRSAVNGVPTAQISPREIRSESGKVILQGSVGDAAALAEVSRRVGLLRGVVSLENQMTVRP